MPGQAQVDPKTIDEAPLFGGADLGLKRPHEVHFCPDQCAVNDVKPQYRYSTIVACGLQVPIEESPGQIRSFAIHEIHDQKCCLRHDVDKPELIVELDAIERHW